MNFYEFNKRGYYVLDYDSYVNSNTKIIISDLEGYRYYTSQYSVIKSKKLRRFDKKNPFTIYNIKNWLRINDPVYHLLSDKYEGVERPLKFIKADRLDLGMFETSWHMFYSDNNRHPKLKIERQTLSRRKKPETIRMNIEEVLTQNYKGWSLSEGEEYKYKNPSSKLRLEHKKGYRAYLRYGILMKKDKLKYVPLFNAKTPDQSMHNMKLWTKEHTRFTVAENQKYIGYKDKYIFICPIHDEFVTNFSTIYSYKSGCQLCYYETKFGENNSNYNPNLTDSDRQGRRHIVGYKQWRSTVMKRDQYTCRCCGDSRGGNLLVHHLDGYHWCVERRTDLNNGVTLCETCHKDFHLIYGYRDNTEQQFLEYLKEKQVGTG